MPLRPVPWIRLFAITVCGLPRPTSMPPLHSRGPPRPIRLRSRWMPVFSRLPPRSPMPRTPAPTIVSPRSVTYFDRANSTA